MIKEYKVCDSCGKISPKQEKEIGWFDIIPLAPMHISLQLDDEYVSVKVQKIKHFCCESCFIEFTRDKIVQLHNQAKEKKNETR